MRGHDNEIAVTPPDHAQTVLDHPAGNGDRGDLPVGQFVDRRVKLFFGFSEKYFGFHAPQINSRTVPVPAHRGAFRDRHGRWAGDAVDAAASGEQQRAGRMMLKRTAKSCRSDAPMLASSLR